jgi:hypothetical protein
MDVITDTALSVASQLFEGNTFLLVAFVIFLVMAYMVFKTVIKAVVVAVAAALFPVFMLAVGFYEPGSVWAMLQTMAWFGLAGVALFFIYSAIATVAKIINMILTPFSLLFRKGKQKVVVVKEKASDKGGKDGDEG